MVRQALLSVLEEGCMGEETKGGFTAVLVDFPHCFIDITNFNPSELLVTNTTKVLSPIQP